MKTRAAATSEVILVTIFFGFCTLGCDDTLVSSSDEFLEQAQIEKAREEYNAMEKEIRNRVFQGDDLSDFSREDWEEWAGVVERARLEKESRELENSLNNLILPPSSRIETTGP